MKYVCNHFGIKKLKSNIEDTLEIENKDKGKNKKLSKKQKNTLKYISNEQIKKQFKDWKLVKINIKNIKGLTNASTFDVYNVKKDGEKTKCINVKGLKKEQDNSNNCLPYAFIGDKNSEYILRFKICKEGEVDKYITKWIKLNNNDSSKIFATQKFNVDYTKIQTSDVKIIVKDENGKAVKGAEVTITDCNDKNFSSAKKSNAKGEVAFKSKIVSGIYNITVTHTKYKDIKKKVTIKCKNSKEFKFIISLKKK